MEQLVSHWTDFHETYSHPPSSSVGLHVLVRMNLSILGSTKIISNMFKNRNISLYYITEIVQFTAVVCMDATFELYALLVAV
jgi:hypothetical protein